MNDAENREQRYINKQIPVKHHYRHTKSGKICAVAPYIRCVRIPYNQKLLLDRQSKHK